MSSSSPAPKLPIWIFLATDAALLIAAAYIAYHSAHPLSETAIFAIVACVIAGAAIGLTPLIAYYERQKNAALDDRQNALEALGRTVSTSAEQISIAASGLHEIAEIAQRNLKQAETLPHKLQEKMAEFQAQLAAASDTEKEELEKELEELRGAETERLQSASDRIARAAADFAKIEATTQQHLAAATEAVGKLSLGTAAAIGKSQVAAEQAFAQARQEAARGVGEAAGHAVKDIQQAQAAALAEIGAQCSLNIRRMKEAADQISAMIERLEASAAKQAAAPATAEALHDRGSAVLQPAPVSAEARAEAPRYPESERDEGVASPEIPHGHRDEGSLPTVASGEGRGAAQEIQSKRDEGSVPTVASDEGRGAAPAATTASQPAAAEATAPAAPKRSRKPRPAPVANEAAPAVSKAEGTDAAPAASQADALQERGNAVLQPAPVSAESRAEAPRSSESERDGGVASPEIPHSHRDGGSLPTVASGEGRGAARSDPIHRDEGVAAPAAAAASAENHGVAPSAAAPAGEPKPARKKPARRVEDDQPGLGLDLGDMDGGEEPRVMERVLSSDGATRLIVTAYIGIGNRLFIRGDGPGLSWDKGVPLQFVSIGKWRWETNDAAAPVQIKLFKNDEQESAGLGSVTIEPGHQHEVTANFA